jgi:hypothetical protein
MQVNRGLVFWGVALITAGAVALAIQYGAIAESAARDAWRLWPIILVVIGLAIIAARTPFALAATAAAGLVVGGMAGSLVAGWPAGLSMGCGGEATELVSSNGSFGDRATVELRLNCGELDVSTASGNGWTVEARHGPDARPNIRDDGNSLSVTVGGGGFIGFTRARQDWDVVLPTEVDLALTIDVNAAASRLDLSDATLDRLRLSANAGDARLDLGGASVTGFDLDANAGSVSIATDRETRLEGGVGMNAGSLELCAPDDAAVEIILVDPNVTFSHNLDQRGFARSGDTWRLGDGAPAIRLGVDGNATSFSYNPDGGCS